MKIHAIQTGSVRVKEAQVRGEGHDLRRRLGVFIDPHWADWLPSYVWVIEHPEGVIVVDTGQSTHVLDHVKSLHRYLRWEIEFRIERDQEIGPQLRTLGIGTRDGERAQFAQPSKLSGGFHELRAIGNRIRPRLRQISDRGVSGGV